MNEIEKLKNRIEAQNEQIRELNRVQTYFEIFITEQGLLGEFEEYTNLMKLKFNTNKP